MNDLTLHLTGDLLREALPSYERLRRSALIHMALAPLGMPADLDEPTAAAEELASVLRRWQDVGALVPPPGHENRPGCLAELDLLRTFAGMMGTGREEEHCRAAVEEVLRLADGTVNTEGR